MAKKKVKAATTKQEAATNEIAKDYNGEAMHILHTAQQEFNKDLQQERKNDHRSYQVIEREAKTLMAKASKEGEVHIVHHLSDSPVIFFASGNKIGIWDNGDIQFIEMKYVKTISRIIVFTSSNKMFLAIRHDGWPTKESSSFAPIYEVTETTDKNTGKVIRKLVKYKDGTPSYHRDLAVVNQDKLIIMNPESVYIGGKEFKPNKKEMYNDLLNGGFLPRIIYSKKENSSFYIQYLAGIQKIDFNKDPKQLHEVILGKEYLNNAIDLARATILTTPIGLAIQDEGKREIGLYIQDDIFESNNWANFKRSTVAKATSAHIPVPAYAFPIGEEFTISFMLFPNFKKPEYRTALAGGKSVIGMWIDKDDNLNYHYVEEGKWLEKQFSIKNQLKSIGKKSWFQIAWHKEGNVFRFFVNGEQVHSADAPDTVGLPGTHLDENNKPVKMLVRISCAGYLMAELRFWSLARTQQQILEYNGTWLTGGKHDGLMGYWRLDRFPFPFFNAATKKIENPKWPDYSGNNLHFKDDEVEGSYEYVASRPIPKIVPLYPIRTAKQGLRIDNERGKIYWVDEAHDGRTYMFSGSMMGHTPPKRLFEIEIDGDFDVLTKSKELHLELILAHAKRRNQMERIMNEATKAQQEGHKKVMQAHKDFDTALTKSNDAFVKDNVDTKKGEDKDKSIAYRNTHEKWLHIMDRMNQQQADLASAVKRQREDAVAQAKSITDKAKSQAADIRKGIITEYHSKKEADIKDAKS